MSNQLTLDQLAELYPTQGKCLPRIKQLGLDLMKVNPKYCFFAFFKILQDIIPLAKSDPNVKPLFDNLNQVVKGFKEKSGVKFDEDKDDFLQFVMNRFNEIDMKVRTGTASIETITDLLDVSYLMEVFSIFGPVSENTLKRKKYAKIMSMKLKKNFDETKDVNKGSAYTPTGIPNDNASYSAPSMNTDYGAPGPGNPFSDPPQPSPAPYSNGYGSSAHSPANPFADDVSEGPIGKMPMPNPRVISAGGMEARGVSTITSHERGLLDRLLNTNQRPIPEKLNSMFSIQVTKMSSNNGPSGAAGPGDMGISFMNSQLYMQNRDEFYMRSFEIQDQMRRITTNDAGRMYQDLLKLKKKYLDILAHK